MIYFKINSTLYNERELEKIKLDYPLYYRKALALHRIIRHELNTTLNIYPEIDIYVTTKNVKHKLGRFTNHITREYKRKNGDAYIILFWH